MFLGVQCAVFSKDERTSATGSLVVVVSVCREERGGGFLRRKEEGGGRGRRKEQGRSKVTTNPPLLSLRTPAAQRAQIKSDLACRAHGTLSLLDPGAPAGGWRPEREREREKQRPLSSLGRRALFFGADPSLSARGRPRRFFFVVGRSRCLSSKEQKGPSLASSSSASFRSPHHGHA